MPRVPVRRLAALSLAALLMAHVGISAAGVAGNLSGPSGVAMLPRPIDATAEERRSSVMGDRLAAIRLIERHTEPGSTIAVPLFSEGLAVAEIGRLYLYPRTLIQAWPYDVTSREADYVLVMDTQTDYGGEPVGSVGSTLTLFRARDT